jgi:hypothetical protein
MKSITESDLHKMGIMIDPSNPTKAIRINDGTENAAPDETWEIERLADYAIKGLEQAKVFEVEANLVARKSTVQLFRAGHALHILQEKLKGDSQWCSWLKEHRIPRTNAWEAIQLFIRAKTESAVTDLTPGEAKQKYGISKPHGQTERQGAGSAGHWPARTSMTGGNRAIRRPRSPGKSGGGEYYDDTFTEDADSPLSVLTAVVDRLSYCKDAIRKNVDWERESPSQYHSVLNDIISMAEELRETLEEEDPLSDAVEHFCGDEIVGDGSEPKDQTDLEGGN